ncbi:hypothetical protein GT037_001396 [Alternaria burnsii]|uniref:GED domain-containing protein n=1 Tax=Alternaria burnsii TaxID=1187904 RepID=A0A8H7BAW5_9PLEO|nr:uncharacterized protein GT037_001396 [Alternaria burnsii]KAF7679745.1 hypothetical protein GT037_001396 [Alternaria burnsii]
MTDDQTRWILCILLFGIAALFLKIISLAIRALSGPLRKVPGPLIARWTRFYLSYQILSGNRMQYIHALHQRYGPVVRVSPIEVAINDPAGVRTIQKTSGGFDKGPWYQNTGPGLLGMRDRGIHSRRRRLLAHSLSNSSLVVCEILIRKKIDLAMASIGHEAKIKGAADIYKWFSLMATDIIGDLTFGSSFCMLETGKKTQYVLDLQAVMSDVHKRAELSPFLDILSCFPIGPAKQAQVRLARIVEYGRQSIARLLMDVETGTLETPVFFDKVLNSAATKDGITRQELEEEAAEFMITGTDTTSNTLTYLIWAVLKHPGVRIRLEEEIATLPDDYTDTDLAKASYLNCVIKESLRLYGTASGSHERSIPPGGWDICGYHLPDQAVVSIAAYSLHRRADIFRNPLKFQPDRWLNPTQNMQECYIPFGGGPRIRLDTLGAPRATAQEQRRYLLQVSQSFSTLVKAAVDRQYSDAFFGDASTTEGYQKRLRAVLQNTLTEFAADMRKKGHTFTILDEGPTDLPYEISRTDYISKVTRLLERSRGRELPGTFDPLIIGHLFHEQRKPWAGLVNQYLDVVLHAVRFLARKALAHVCDETSLAGISRRFIYVRLGRLTAELRDKVAELLKPHDTGHPITYNHYLTESVQKAQSARQVREIRKSLEGILGGDFTESGVRYFQMDVNVMINALVSKTEADMNTYASSTATDFMEAYYKVAQKKIIDDFSVLAVEARLIQELPSLFSPADVIDIDDVTVAKLASESEESSRERTRFSEKLKVQEHGHNALQGVQDISPLEKDTEEVPSEYSIGSDDENGSSELEAEPEPEPELVEILPHEEEPSYVVGETSGPDQVATPGNQWDFSPPISVLEKKKKAVKRTHRPVEVLAE